MSLNLSQPQHPQLMIQSFHLCSYSVYQTIRRVRKELARNCFNSPSLASDYVLIDYNFGALNTNKAKLVTVVVTQFIFKNKFGLVRAS